MEQQGKPTISLKVKSKGPGERAGGVRTHTSNQEPKATDQQGGEVRHH